MGWWQDEIMDFVLFQNHETQISGLSNCVQILTTTSIPVYLYVLINLTEFSTILAQVAPEVPPGRQGMQNSVSEDSNLRELASKAEWQDIGNLTF